MRYVKLIVIIISGMLITGLATAIIGIEALIIRNNHSIWCNFVGNI